MHAVHLHGAVSTLWRIGSHWRAGELAGVPGFSQLSYLIQQANYRKIQNPELWTNLETVDAWRHQRMYRMLDPLMQIFPASKWVTIGDGRYGNDAHHLESLGARRWTLR